MTTTEGMKGSGYYDEHSEYQRSVAATGVSLIERCVATLPMPAPDLAVVIVDYGASTGANSLASVRAAVGAVRGRNAQQPVAAVHNDLPTNDWNQLFANLASRPDSYAHLDGPPVLPMASAISFFQPAVPPASAHLGMSFSAAHWLRHQPSVTVPEGFYFCEAKGAARSGLAAQADADWTAFLIARAADLAPAGRLLVQMVGSEEPESGGEPHVTARKLLRGMAEVARDLVVAGKLDAGAVDRYVLAVYARTPTEARAPLERSGSQVADAFEVDTIRTDPVANHLFEPGVTPGNDPKQVLDDYFARLTARFTADPEADAFEDWTLTVMLTRR